MNRKRMRNIIYLFFCAGFFTTCHAQPKIKSRVNGTDTVYTMRRASADGTGKYYLGREIAQVMGAEGGDWLERDSRQQEENTRLAIEKINLSPQSTIADIGAGTGYYSFRLAAKVPRGSVYAVEIQDKLVEYLVNKKRLLKDSVVQVVKGSDHSPNLPASSIDIAMMVDVYHELAFPHEMLQAIRNALKPHGKLLLIEYRGEDASIPIKALHKTTVAQLNRELGANGFEPDYKGEFLPIQHFLLYRKK